MTLPFGRAYTSVEQDTNCVQGVMTGSHDVVVPETACILTSVKVNVRPEDPVTTASMLK